MINGNAWKCVLKDDDDDDWILKWDVLISSFWWYLLSNTEEERRLDHIASSKECQCGTFSAKGKGHEQIPVVFATISPHLKGRENFARNFPHFSILDIHKNGR